MSADGADRRPDGDAPLLELEDVQAYYGLAHVLQGITLTVRAGELVALLGRNGAGKTTTVKSIMGLVTVRGGKDPLRRARTSSAIRPRASPSSASATCRRTAACSRA